MDQNVVNDIIIGGFLNLFSRIDSSEQLKTKVSELESELKTSRLRIESLENWITKNDGETKAMKKDVVPSEQKENMINQNEDAPKNVQQKCKKCGELFNRNCDFENHMEKAHNEKNLLSVNPVEKNLF